MKVPEGWKTRTLGEVATIQRGRFSVRPRNDPRYYGGTVPFLQTGDVAKSKGVLRNYTQTLNEQGVKVSKIFPAGSLIMTIAANIGDIAEVPFAFACPDSLVVIRPNTGVSKEWLKQVLLELRPVFHNLAPENAQANISLELIKPVKVVEPGFDEQTNIAATLSTWDSAIEKTERLLAAKKKLLVEQYRQRFWGSGELGQGLPKARLSDLFEQIEKRTGNQLLEPYSISAGSGFVSQAEKFGKDISGEQYKNYICIGAGDFSYNKGNSKRFPQGCIYLWQGCDICVPSSFISFRKKDPVTNSDFFRHYFLANGHSAELKKYITSGARGDGLLNVNTADFFRILVPAPAREVQNDVADKFNAMEHEIQLLSKLAELYKLQKRGLMQKLLTGQWRVAQ